MWTLEVKYKAPCWIHSPQVACIFCFMYRAHAKCGMWKAPADDGHKLSLRSKDNNRPSKCSLDTAELGRKVSHARTKDARHGDLRFPVSGPTTRKGG